MRPGRDELLDELAYLYALRAQYQLEMELEAFWLRAEALRFQAEAWRVVHLPPDWLED